MVKYIQVLILADNRLFHNCVPALFKQFIGINYPE